MKYMMDANICIYAIKNKLESVIRKTLSQDPESLCISVVTYTKFIHGIRKNQAVEKNRVVMSLFLSTTTALDFDGEATEAYGQIRAELGKRDTPIDPMDPLIAGHAGPQDLILVTNNTRGFARVTGLRIEDQA